MRMASEALPRLTDLGPRICVMGPSNAGKSTLADALARRLGLPVIHLDQLHHTPGSNWVPRPRAEFLALHDEAVAGERWVMDGNYSDGLPRRLARATGLIVLDVPAWFSLVRYLRRCLFERDRVGALEGAADSVKWLMIRYILFQAPANRRRYATLVGEVGIPAVRLFSRRRIMQAYAEWGLAPRGTLLSSR